MNDINVIKNGDNISVEIINFNLRSNDFKMAFLEEFKNSLNLFSEEFLKHLASDPDENIRIFIAEHVNSISILEKLSNDHNNDVPIIRHIIYNEKCTLSILEKLYLRRNDDINVFLAKSDKCSIDLLEKLSNGDWLTKVNVINNINCPISILEKLSNHKNEAVICAILNRKDCPESIFHKLSNNFRYNIRISMIRNLNCPSIILEKLYKDFPNDVIEHPNCPDYLKALSQ